jgi:hypothetical protein
MDSLRNEIVEMLSQLNGVIGRVCSENFSPTLRAKLISFDPISGVCIMEVVPSPYRHFVNNNDRAGERYEAPAWRVWNAYFF